MNRRLFLEARLASLRTTRTVFSVLAVVSCLSCEDRSSQRVEAETKERRESDATNAPTSVEQMPSSAGAVRDDKAVPAASGQLLAIEGNEQRTVRLAEVIPRLKPRIVETDDPYYQRVKRFWGVPVDAFLQATFESENDDLVRSTFVVKAKDGYAVHLPGEKLLNGAAFLAFADAEHERFVPITEQRADPAPLYLVWEGERSDLKEFPRPWAIASIERTAEDAGLERTVPEDGFGDNLLAGRGNELFKQECIRCHAINQQGGKVGPDLNVPQNILAYRPEEQVRKYIRDPKTFRYSNMPPHLELSDEDLDALIAYLSLMGRHQVDPHVDVTPETAHDHD